MIYRTGYRLDDTETRASGKRARVISYRASTPALDRHGTRILPDGIRTDNFDRNPIFLWAHDGYSSMAGPPRIDSTIGRVVNYRRTRQAFDVDVEYATEDVNPNAERAYRLAEAGFLNSVSIGFEPIKAHEDLEDEDGRAAGLSSVRIYDESDLLEVSLVPVPSNPQAQTLARALAAGPRTKEFDVLLARLGRIADRAFPDPASPAPEAADPTEADPLVERLSSAISRAIEADSLELRLARAIQHREPIRETTK